MKIFTRRATRMLTLALTAGALIYGTAVPQANAQDRGRTDQKILPGAMCQPTDFPNNAIPAYSFTGEVRNEDDSQILEVVCPLVRENTLSRRGVTALVHVNDNHPTQDIECNLDARDRFGNRQNTSGNTTSRGTGRETITMAVSRSAINNSYYSIRCVVPPVFEGGVPSDIASIRYVEQR